MEVKKKIEDCELTLVVLKNLIAARTSKITGMPQSRSYDSPVEKLTIKITDTENKIGKLKITLEETMKQLEEKIIAEVDDTKAQMILILRYVECMKFAGIGAIIGYSEKHTRRLHKKALELLSISET